MRKAIVWVKTNPISLVAIAMIPVALGVLVFVQLSGSSLKAEIKKEDKSIKSLEALKRSNVEIPSENPEEPLRSESFTITAAAIDKMTRIRDRMDEDYQQIKDGATRHNRGDDGPYPHKPMIEGLFPRPEGHEGKEYDAQAAYKRALYEFSQPAVEDGTANYPRMNAGRALVMQELEEKIAQFMDDQVPVDTLDTAGGMSAMPEEEYHELRDKAYAHMIGLVRDHASRIHIYANTPVRTGDGEDNYIIGPDTPFHVGEWVLVGDRPTMTELWQAQVDLWIQQDIVEAIAMANRTDDPQESVLTVPVKRLLKIDISPGYVGRTAEGMVVGYKREKVRGSTVTARNRFRGGGRGDMRSMYGGMMGPQGGMSGRVPPAGFGGGMPGGPGFGGFGGFGRPGMSPQSSYFGGEDDGDGMGGDGEKTEDFALSPTGRCSNALYDVRHATLKVVIDSKRIPLFLQALSHVNFTTVLLATVKDIDEYAHLSGDESDTAATRSEEGQSIYVYGSDDAVELEVVLETIWLRSWTAGDVVDPEDEERHEGFEAGLMPDDVRESLGLERRERRPGGSGEQWSDDE